MSALVIDFAAAVAARRGQAGTHGVRSAAEARMVQQRHPALDHDFAFWNGASGAAYVHTVYGLLDCPALPDASYVLVRKSDDSPAEALHVGTLESGSPSLNLAEVRHKAALLGANEVHVHLLAGSEQQRRRVASDLQVYLMARGRVAS